MRRLLLIPLILAYTGVLSAEDLDADTLKALEQTQNIMKDPALRAAQPEAQGPQAAALQAQLKALGGTAQDQEQIFQIAAQVMGDLTKKTQGDPAQMQKVLDQAMKNPEAFGQSLSPQEQQQIRDLAKKLPAPGSSGKMP